MSISLRTGITEFTLRLNPRFRFSLYSAFAVLFSTGIGWLFADLKKDSADGDIWQQTGAYLLMLHGGGAMLTLLLIGALIPVHIRREWRSGNNLVSGSIMIAFNALLVMTAFGLYYLGSEALRPWISWVHITVGICLPVLFVVHILLGRLTR